MENLVTPLNVDLYEQLLKQSKYNKAESEFLVNGLRYGFDIGYKGPTERQSESRNIPFTVGNQVEMWNKIMKEVNLKGVAGPFEEIPFTNYIQSPIGLIPKAGNKTRLIFHLSYNFGGETSNSVNACTPRDICTIHYNDLDAAICSCLEVSEEGSRILGTSTIFLGKTDLTSTFRILCMNCESFCWLVFKAVDPSDGKTKYFIDKCLPFRSSISCSHYQRFSNSLRHSVQYRSGRKSITNYLDDFLFVAYLKHLCNQMIKHFIQLCEELRLPVAHEKTEYASTLVVFLGILLDGKRLLLSIPLEKQEKALKLLNDLTGKKKITVKQLQVLTGYLNFLTKAIVPGRTFTRRIYSKYSGRNVQLKQHHHVAINSEFHFDCEIWRYFLLNYREAAVCRPMIDVNKSVAALELDFYSDASAAVDKGMGAIFGPHWFFARWENNFIQTFQPSIEYLELLAVTAVLLTWDYLITNQRVIIYCNNQAVVVMINNMTSSCKNCMYLIRLIAINNLIHNRRVFVNYVKSLQNSFADTLSRIDLPHFW